MTPTGTIARCDVPRFRKPQPVMLNEDHMYALTLQLLRHVAPKPKGGWGPNKPTKRELGLLREVYEIINNEWRARAKEDARINAELALIEAEYEGSE